MIDELFAPLIDSPNLTLTTTYWNDAKSQLKDMILKHFDNLEESIKQHTVPEGQHLVTRSYVLNSINYERAKLNELFEGKDK